jgi:hypothetical protein
VFRHIHNEPKPKTPDSRGFSRVACQDYSAVLLMNASDLGAISMLIVANRPSRTLPHLHHFWGKRWGVMNVMAISRQSSLLLAVVRYRTPVSRKRTPQP